MIKILVAYDSKYGNTKLASEHILKGILKIGEIEPAIGYVKEINFDKIIEFDVIVIGGPNHMGRPSRTLKKFINQLTKLDLKTKNVAIFGTYAGKMRIVDRAVKKLQKIVEKKLPDLNLISDTLSIRVNGMKGPIVEGELPKCMEFGKKIASQFLS